MAVVADTKRNRLIAVYSDKMVFLWDVKDTEKIQVTRTFLAHNGPIHDIQKVPAYLKIGFNDSEDAK